MNFLEANNWFGLENKENAEGVVNCYLEAHNLQLQQTFTACFSCKIINLKLQEL